MSIFQELVFDVLCGPRGRFIPGMLLEGLRQEWAQPATVPVPRSEPKSPNVHVAQVATKPNSPDFATAFARIAAIWET